MTKVPFNGSIPTLEWRMMNYSTIESLESREGVKCEEKSIGCNSDVVLNVVSTPIYHPQFDQNWLE